jgi:hypothetical protein
MQSDKQSRDYDLQKREQRIQAAGQLFAFLVSMTAIGGGLWLAGSEQQPVTGGIITGGTVLSIVVAFLKTRKPVPLP